MNDQQIFKYLEQIQPDCVSYRHSMDQLFGTPSDGVVDWRTLYLDILIAATKLYLDYLLVTEHLSAFEAVAVKRRKTIDSETGIEREMGLRRKLAHALDDPTRWISFEPVNAFSEMTGLVSLQAYKNNLILHLPEIYEETLRVEIFAKSFLSNQNSAALARLSVGLDHLGRNHISFVLQTLQWLSDEGSWNEPSLDTEQ